MSQIDFEDGQFGTKATVRVPWYGALIQPLRERDIRELELNLGKGWRGTSIEFLRELPNLRSLTILDQTLDEIGPIHCLHELVHLHLESYSDMPVDFTAFPELTDCWFEWIKGSDSLFDCISLKSLGLNNYKKKSSYAFSNLKRLKQLALLNSSLEDLSGIYELGEVTSLKIARLRKLSSVAGIAALKNLELLEIHTCKGIDSISEVFSLDRLKILFLVNMATIDTLQGLEKLTELEEFIFYESTNIADGDLSPILSLKNLKKISFQNRRHYSHRREDFEGLYFDS